MNQTHQLILVTAPDLSCAESLAESLVEQKLAACVNLLPNIKSIYRWKEKIERSSECLLLIKTKAELYPNIELAIKREHPYECPEIIAVTIDQGLPDYLTWIASETK